MKTVLTRLAMLIGVLLFLHIGIPCALLLSAPSIPSNADHFQAFHNRLDAIVDQHWKRPDAVPTADDLAAYQALIDDLKPFDYALLSRAHAQSLRMSKKAQQDMHKTAEAYEAVYQAAYPYVGRDLSEFAAFAVVGPMRISREMYYYQVQRYRAATGEMVSLLPDARYHMAMALILAGDNQGAINQLTSALKENPEYAMLSGTYTIGSRCGADQDVDFIAALTAAGASKDWFKAEDSQRIRPWYGTQFFGFR